MVALWREALLAQAVLRGRTIGYRAHPQLTRFRAQSRPIAAIAAYLRAVHDEAAARGYRFARAKIARAGRVSQITETRGQVAHEWGHLRRKLRKRDPARLAGLRRTPEAHPLFAIVPGRVRDWERRPRRPSRSEPR